MKSIAQNYNHYIACWLAFDDKEALAKSEEIIRSIPAQSVLYFWAMV